MHNSTPSARAVKEQALQNVDIFRFVRESKHLTLRQKMRLLEIWKGK